jgi:hypothetical protein
MFLQCLFMFVNGTITDILLALWTITVTKKQKILAPILSMATGACSLILLLSTIANGFIPGLFWILGLGVGTYIAIIIAGKIEKKKG